MSDEQTKHTSLTEPMTHLRAPGTPPRHRHRTDPPVRCVGLGSRAGAPDSAAVEAPARND
ncbi:hypothetical protein ABT024_40265 [Streptomyces sp. NPDC002812]|jgi:hypothetical protein|uniref:hypothetical protein n=1 Tax=Streptomyces sp. NPDC002812 TaxID=3154434 RepID=UPI0019AE5374|nr:hypothetical protein GCM10010499_00030 [Streptomyces thermoviolaceus subsp. apingens]GHB13118.1 hypothetical protein GCM10010512_50640 [Streptomyces thermoviolaceus subsp. thermoviolaceus]